MLWRCFQLLVVLAWIGSTALLVRKSYFPDLGRFPRVDNSLVSDLYFKNGQTSDLLLLWNGKGAVGRLTITPRRFSVRLEDAGFSDQTGELFFTGRFDGKNLGGPAPLIGEVVWNGSIFVGETLEPRGMRLQVRVRQLNLSGQIVVEEEPRRVAYQVKQNGQVVFDSKDGEKNRATMAQLALVGRMAGIEMPQGEGLGDLETLMPELEPDVSCRHGRFTILGRRYDGYIVQVKWGPEAQLKFLITELGELLRLDGIPQLDILGESFVPEELMEEEEGVDDP